MHVCVVLRVPVVQRVRPLALPNPPHNVQRENAAVVVHKYAFSPRKTNMPYLTTPFDAIWPACVLAALIDCIALLHHVTRCPSRKGDGWLVGGACV